MGAVCGSHGFIVLLHGLLHTGHHDATSMALLSIYFLSLMRFRGLFRMDLFIVFSLPIRHSPTPIVHISIKP